MFVAVACVALMIGQQAQAATSPTDDHAFARLAKSDLAAAQRQLAFDIKLPLNVPKGFRLIRVSWTGTAVDLVWRRASDGGSLHVWQSAQTDAELGAKIPGRAGIATRIGGTEWSRTVAGGCTDEHPCFTRRLSDGVLIDMNGTLSEASIRRIAKTLR